MFNFDRTDVQRIGGAAVGALILSCAAVGAALGPARVVESGPAAYAKAPVMEEARG